MIDWWKVLGLGMIVAPWVVIYALLSWGNGDKHAPHGDAIAPFSLPDLPKCDAPGNAICNNGGEMAVYGGN